MQGVIDLEMVAEEYITLVRQNMSKTYALLEDAWTSKHTKATIAIYS